MHYSVSITFILYLTIWLNINIIKTYAYNVGAKSNSCTGILSSSGNKNLTTSFITLINLANSWDSEACKNESYQVNIEKGTYKMDENIVSKAEVCYSYFEPEIFYYGISFFELKKNIEFIGEVNSKTKEPLTTFECPSIGFLGFLDVIYMNRSVTFKNIRFANCYRHWFKIVQFTSFDDDHQPEYKFENCLFEKNYDESIFFYEYVAGDTLANSFSVDIDGILASSTKRPLIFRINNSTFKDNHVWNRKKCGYNIDGTKGDCYFGEDEINLLKKEHPEYYKYLCSPSESDHGIASIMIITPLYYHCKINYGNCYGSLENTLFVSNSKFEYNTGGERGLFDLRCIGALFENNEYVNNWGLDDGLIFIYDTSISITGETVKNQHSLWGNSNALYQVYYSNLTISDSNFENIESQSSSIINILGISTRINITDSTFTDIVFPFENNAFGSVLTCTNCVIKNVKRTLSKNKPSIAGSTGNSYMNFINSEIYNVTSLPLFKISESSTLTFKNTIFHEIDSLANIGLLNIMSTASAVMDECEVHSVNFKKVLDSASFINLSSSGYLSINNTRVHDINIDGDYINVVGSDKDINSLYIENSTFENINSKTGSIIKTSTNECKFQIKNSKFINNIRTCDSEDDVLENCSGVITVNSNIGESTIDQCTFESNESGIGSAITLLNFDHIELNIQNTKFIKNYSINQGGAIYIKGTSYLDNKSNSLKMRNLEFIENRSNSGGAMYINLPGYKKESIKNSVFKNNIADNGGGVFYFPYNVTNNQPSFDGCVFEGNSASFGERYASDPKKIELKINKLESYNGEAFDPLVYRLKDEYNNVVSTSFEGGTFSLQNMVFVKALVVSKESTSPNNYQLAENIDVIGGTFGYFQNGNCSFNLEFYSKEPGDYKLMLYVSLSGYTYDIYNIIDLKMIECPSGLILRDTVESTYKKCVLAECDEEHKCVTGQGRCTADNVCTCEEGYTGDICDQQKLYNLKKSIKVYSMLLIIVGIAFACIFFIYVLIKKEKLIVKVSGILNLLFITLGCIVGFLSIFFDYGEPTKYSCALRELFINMGYVLVYTVLYFKMYSYIINNIPENITFSASTSLKSNQGDSKAGGAATSSLRVSKFDMSVDVKSGFNFVSTTNNGNDFLKQTNQNKRELESVANAVFRKQYIEGLRKSYHRIYAFILILFTLCLITTVCLYLKEDKLERTQMSDYTWAITCESQVFAPVPYAIHFLLLLILFTNVKKCYAISNIHAEAKHICYSLGVWLSLGPLVQLICVSMLNQTPNVRMAMMSFSIFSSNFIIDFFIVGLKMYAILRGCGDSTNYRKGKYAQFYNEPSVADKNTVGMETTNSFRQ
ncbi:hypothetical protein BCR32DRAFT_268872 [Anaeromyces robustus]|uniref:G-protein coupled receptors family 3 profile domain-containing protein n=1 Tax=Anaeromyces robustus TaxID=1754192 RepID=A0A1Y1X473_9FUNG|nr:hypothetical protein BCR32DRAFT_268872 [Anaeromyces robustus]|eukprot:ORX80438.1 hypothetical protein BCR32DRAFT_268872 [Anaeromyces robustus]